MHENEMFSLEKLKNKQLETWREMMPQIDEVHIAKDVALLFENFIDQGHNSSLDEAVSLLHSAGLCYSELLCHQLISVQPVTEKFPMVFYNKGKESSLEKINTPSPQRIELNSRWLGEKVKNSFREGTSEDFTKLILDLSMKLTVEWDRYVLKNLNSMLLV